MVLSVTCEWHVSLTVSCLYMSKYGRALGEPFYSMHHFYVYPLFSKKFQDHVMEQKEKKQEARHRAAHSRNWYVQKQFIPLSYWLKRSERERNICKDFIKVTWQLKYKVAYFAQQIPFWWTLAQNLRTSAFVLT